MSWKMYTVQTFLMITRQYSLIMGAISLDSPVMHREEKNTTSLHTMKRVALSAIWKKKSTGMDCEASEAST